MPRSAPPACPDGFAEVGLGPDRFCTSRRGETGDEHCFLSIINTFQNLKKIEKYEQKISISLANVLLYL